MFQECFKGVSRVLQGGFKSVLRVFQECFESVSRVSHKKFKKVSKGPLSKFQGGFQEGFKDVSRTFIELSSVFQECLKEV